MRKDSKREVLEEKYKVQIHDIYFFNLLIYANESIDRYFPCKNCTYVK